MKQPAPHVPDEHLHPQPIPVGTRMGRLHPLLQATRETLTHKDQSRNRPQQDDAPPVRVKVTPKSLPRALRLLDALFKALERRGHTVEYQGGYWPGAVVRVGGQAVRFSLHEHQKRLEQPLTQEQLAQPWWQRPSKYRYEYQGQLVFELDLYTDRSVRKTWRDSSKTKLEEQLHHIFDGIVRGAEALRLDAEVKAERERVQREAEERKAEEERRRREEHERRERLEKQAEQHVKAERIRAYIQAAKITLNATPNENPAALGRWLEWASAYANGLDPLTNGDLEKELASAHFGQETSS